MMKILVKKEIIEWAKTKDCIRQVFLYGSRARGDYRENSDWDVAVVIDDSENEDNFTIWICEGWKWEKELKKNTNLDIHLEWLDLEDNDTPIVLEKYKKGNILIYNGGDKEII